MSKVLRNTHLIAALAAMSFCGIAEATFQTLAQRLPPTSDAIVAVNVAKLIASPYGKQAEWGQRMADTWAKQPLMIPPGAKRLLMAAEVKPSSMEATWEMSLIEMDKLPSLEQLAKDEGGYVDRVWDRDAVNSPINAYFVPLEDNVLASITPAERSQIARWVRQPVKPEGVVTSAYIKNAVAALSEQTDIVMAMDLEGAYGVPNVRRWLGTAEIKEVNPKEIEALSQVLATMNGITLDIRVTDKITGKATVSFDRDTVVLREAAKPIMLALLNQVGMKIDEIPNWTFTSTGKQVTMQGDLSDGSLRRLLSIVQSPIPAATVAEQPAAGRSGAASTPAEASQRYYKAIASILDNARAGGSPSETASWIRSASKRIDQLPLLNVDPALAEWGMMVSTRMKQIGNSANITQTQINSRVAGVSDPAYTYTWDETEDSVNRVNRENANKQRRQVALEQKAQAQEQAQQVLNDIAESRSRIRIEMTNKYSVEF